MRYLNTVSLAVFAWTMLTIAGYADAPEPAAIGPEQAKNHIAEKVIVEMLVRRTKFSGHTNVVYLDSQEDYMHEDNLGVVLKEEALNALKAKGIENPAEHFLNKTIRVRGTIASREERTYLDVFNLEQLTIIEKK